MPSFTKIELFEKLLANNSGKTNHIIERTVRVKVQKTYRSQGIAGY